MRKLTFAVLALGLCVSCQKDNLGGEIDPTPVPDGSYVFNISVGGSSTFDSGSKAVKSGWEDGDKVFLFFTDGGSLTGKGYVTLTYRGSDGPSWEATVEPEFPLRSNTGTVTAVFVPQFSKMFDIDNNTEGKKDSDGNGIVDVYQPTFDSQSNTWTIECGDVYYSNGSAEYTVRSSGGTNYVTADVTLYIADGYAQFYMYRGKSDDVENTDGNAGNYGMTCYQTGTQTPNVQNYNKVKVAAVAAGGVSPDDPFEQGYMKGYNFGNGTGTVFYGKVVNSSVTTVDIAISDVAKSDLYQRTVEKLATNGVFKPIAYKFDLGSVSSTSSVTKGGTKAASDWKKTEGVLPGLFNIGTAQNPQYVRFSKGNLYCTATQSGKNYYFTYAFADKQYTWAERNVTNGIEKETKTNSRTYISYFFAFSEKIGNDWSGDTFNAFTHIYLVNDIIKNNSNGKEWETWTENGGGNKNLVREWGTAFGSSSPWYTMSWSEWTNLCANQTVVKCTVNTVSGWLLVPANCKYTINKGTNYTESQFQQLEKEGLVFLPAAGYYGISPITRNGDWLTQYKYNGNVGVYCTSSNHYPYYWDRYLYFCACYAVFNGDGGFVNVSYEDGMSTDGTKDHYYNDKYTGTKDSKHSNYLYKYIGNHCFEDFTAGSVRLVLKQ